mgnify:CR=1 FL=1
MNRQTKPVKADVATQNIWLGKMGFDFDAKTVTGQKYKSLAICFPKRRQRRMLLVTSA